MSLIFVKRCPDHQSIPILQHNSFTRAILSFFWKLNPITRHSLSLCHHFHPLDPSLHFLISNPSCSMVCFFSQIDTIRRHFHHSPDPFGYFTRSPAIHHYQIESHLSHTTFIFFPTFLHHHHHIDQFMHTKLILNCTANYNIFWRFTRPHFPNNPQHHHDLRNRIASGQTTLQTFGLGSPNTMLMSSWDG